MSVAIGDGFLVAGAPWKTVDAADFSGKAYIFQSSGTGAWDASPWELTPGAPHANDYFGIPVALRGDLAIAGCMFRDDADTDSGAAYIYTRRSANTWDLQKTLTPSDAGVGTCFGWSIAVGDTYTVIGATHPDNYPENGGAYVFK